MKALLETPNTKSWHLIAPTTSLHSWGRVIDVIETLTLKHCLFDVTQLKLKILKCEMFITTAEYYMLVSTVRDNLIFFH